LEGQYAKIEKLDPSDRAAVQDAQMYLLADVGRVFGVGSAEWSQIFQNNIVNEPEYLNLNDYDGDFHEGSWQHTDKAARVKAGIEKMLPRIRRLIDRAKERAALHGAQGEDPMNAFKVFEEHFQLIKPSGERHPSRGIWSNDVVTVHDGRCSAAIGDVVERTLPNGTVEHREVANVRFEKGFRPIPDAYHLDLRNSNARPAAPAAAPVVNHHTTYNIHGVAGAVGPGATATGNTLVGQVTQWNGVDRDQLAAEVAKLRAALATEATEDDDAASELGPVGDASKALKAGDESGFMSAMKKLGSKAWAVVQTLGLTYLDYYGRQYLGLPPAGGT
jgi:hypothetical protein